MEFTLFNQNLRYFAVVHIGMEFQESGTVRSSIDIRSLRLEDGVTLMEKARVGFEVVVLLMILHQIFEEWSELSTQGTAKYFSSFFNLMDWGRYALSAAIVFFYAMTLMHVCDGVGGGWSYSARMTPVHTCAAASPTATL